MARATKYGVTVRIGFSGSVRCDGAPHRTAPHGGQIAGADRGTLPNSQSTASPLSFRFDGMPPLFPRTMADVDDAEATRKWSALSPPPTSSPTISTSAPSPLPTAAIDLTSDISPPASLSMVASATSGHVQATQSLALPQLPAFHLPAAAPPSHFMRCMQATAWKTLCWHRQQRHKVWLGPRPCFIPGLEGGRQGPRPWATPRRKAAWALRR